MPRFEDLAGKRDEYVIIVIDSDWLGSMSRYLVGILQYSKL